MVGDVATKMISSIIVTRLNKNIATLSINEQYGSLFKKECADIILT